MTRTQRAFSETDQVPLPFAPNPNKTVSGRLFTHGINERIEYYEHVDEATGMLWTIRRHTDQRAQASAREVWCAYAATPEPGGTVALINGTVTREGEVLSKGALADVDDRDPDALLAAMIPLIERGRLPEEKSHKQLTIITNGAARQFLPDPLESLYSRLETLTLDPSCEDSAGFYTILPNGDAHAWGRFLEGEFFFSVYGPPDEMAELGAAIERARGTERYRQALEQRRQQSTCANC